MIKALKFGFFLGIVLSLASLIGYANTNNSSPIPNILEFNSSSSNTLSIHSQLPKPIHGSEEIHAVEIELEETSTDKKASKIVLPSVISFCVSEVHSVDAEVSNTEISTSPNFYPTSFRCLLFEVFRI